MRNARGNFCPFKKRYGVAKRRPAHATNPADRAYDWTLYDRTVNYAAQNGVHVVFSIYGTPRWANGGRGLNVAPKRANDLRNFAFAAGHGQWPASATSRDYRPVQPRTGARVNGRVANHLFDTCPAKSNRWSGRRSEL